MRTPPALTSTHRGCVADGSSSNSSRRCRFRINEILKMCPQKTGKQFSGKTRMRSFWESQVAERRHVKKIAAFSNDQPELARVRFVRYSLHKPGASALRLINRGAVHLGCNTCGCNEFRQTGHVFAEHFALQSEFATFQPVDADDGPSVLVSHPSTGFIQLSENFFGIFS